MSGGVAGSSSGQPASGDAPTFIQAMIQKGKDPTKVLLLQIALGHGLNPTRSPFALIPPETLETIARILVDMVLETRQELGLATPPDTPSRINTLHAPPPVKRKVGIARVVVM